MPIDPGTAFLIGKGFDAVGGLLDNSDQKNRQEQQRQFNEQHRFAEDTTRTDQAFTQVDKLGEMQRRLEMMPLRDRVMFMMQSRMGQVPQKFQGNDMFNPGGPAPQQGGVDTAALTRDAASYRPGAGGTDPRVLQTLMAKLGYTNGPKGPTVGEPVTRPGSILPRQGPGPIVGPGGVTNPESVDTSGAGPNAPPKAPAPPAYTPPPPGRWQPGGIPGQGGGGLPWLIPGRR